MTDVNKDWSIETLRIFTEERFTGQEKAVSAALNSAQQTIETLSAATTERFVTQEKMTSAALSSARQSIEALTAVTQAQFVSQEKAFQAALFAAKEALDRANAATEKRFDSVNEFRAQLKDQAGTFITRSEIDARIASIEARITRHEMEAADVSSSNNAKAKISAPLWGLAAAALTAAFAALLSWIMHKPPP